MHTYYESAQYECEDKPGTFGSIKITGDDYGPCFVFATDDGKVLFDLPIPACEAMAIRYALDKAIKRTMRAGERDDEQTIHAHAEMHAGPQPEPAMTPYGPREIPGLPAERVALPRAADRFMERAPGFTPPASWAGRQPAA